MFHTSPTEIPIYDNITLPIAIKTEKEDGQTQVHEYPYEEMNATFYNRNPRDESNLTTTSSNGGHLHDYMQKSGDGGNFSINVSSLLAKQSLRMEKSSLISSDIGSTISSIVKEKNYAVWRSPFEVGFCPSSSGGKPNIESTCTTLTSATTSVVTVPSVLHIGHSDNQQNGQDRRDDTQKHTGVLSRISTLFTQAGNDDIKIVEKLVLNHDSQYKAINFGEDVIKEMIMSSVFGIPVSAKAAMTAYKLMIQRVTRVAQNFTDFLELPSTAQTTLLKNNADMIVSLRGAVFFEMKKQGLDQILSSLGINDLQSARDMIFATMKCHNTLKHIDYKTFNTIQDKCEISTEKRYDQLLEQIGSTIAFNPNLVILFSYVLLFSVSFKDYDIFDEISREKVLRINDALIGLLERYLFAMFPNDIANGIFSAIMNCIGDLRELTLIKKKRQLSAPITTKPPDKSAA